MFFKSDFSVHVLDVRRPIYVYVMIVFTYEHVYIMYMYLYVGPIYIGMKLNSACFNGYGQLGKSLSRLGGSG